MQPRPAATVVVARDSVEGPEILVLERHAGSRFAPGFLVFSGGVVEPGDPALARAWFGSEDEVERACAVRELYEETGLLATAEGVRSLRPDRPIEEVAFSPPSISTLPEMSRWVAPEFLAVRFDARFFALAASPDTRPTLDGVEIERAWWASPGSVLESAKRGDASLMWPTLKTLQALTACRSVGDVLSLRVPQEEPPGGVIPGDPARRRGAP